MGSVNKAIVVGNLGRNAECRFTPAGQPVASFSVATTEKFKTKDGTPKEETEWHRIVLWGKQAETLQPYLVKGKSVYVEGKLQTRQWEKDGQKHYTTEINADRIVLLGGKDAKLAKSLIGRYDEADLRRWLEAFFKSRDSFIQGSTYSLGVFSSCLGKLIAADVRVRVETVDEDYRAMRRRVEAEQEALEAQREQERARFRKGVA